VVESAVAPIRYNTHMTGGGLTNQRTMRMIFRSGPRAENNWRRLHGFQQLGKVTAGYEYKDGTEVGPKD